MDRVEKIHLFSLYVSLKYHGASLLNEMIDKASKMANHYPETTWLSQVLPAGNIAISKSVPAKSLFHKSQRHLSDDQAAAFTMTLKPHHHNMTIDAATNLFKLPDFHVALCDYFPVLQTYADRHGQCKRGPNVHLPFSHIHVWNNFRMQEHLAQDERVILPSCTIQVLPPSDDMPFGQCNTVLVKDTDGSAERTSQESSSKFPFCRFSNILPFNSSMFQGAELSKFG